MCDRARLSSDVGEIKLVFRIPPERPTPNIAPSWNLAPTDPLPVVRYDAKDHQRSLDVMRRGLVPFWAKDNKVGFAHIKAKAEGTEKKPAFSEAFRQRRCLVPVDNFYEWQKTPSGKPPYAIGLKGGGLMALAGLCESWRSPTCEDAASRSSPRRMARRGTGGRAAAEIPARALPCRWDGLARWPVSARVGNRSEPY
jgi:putative SOS response-associated peptidase YedK